MSNDSRHWNIVDEGIQVFQITLNNRFEIVKSVFLRIRYARYQARRRENSLRRRSACILPGGQVCSQACRYRPARLASPQAGRAAQATRLPRSKSDIALALPACNKVFLL